MRVRRRWIAEIFQHKRLHGLKYFGVEWGGGSVVEVDSHTKSFVCKVIGKKFMERKAISIGSIHHPIENLKNIVRRHRSPRPAL
jgi:hypothetical protein